MTQDEEPDLMEDIDHLDSDDDTVILAVRHGNPVVIWVDDADGIDSYLDGTH